VQYGVKRFHHISTDEVYGSLALGEAAFTEITPLAPNNPYSASKAGADLLVRSYHKTFGIDTVITRCSNNFGPNQDDTKLIPRFIKKLQAGQTVPLYGDGSNRRDWLHVSDHVSAIDLVFHNGRAGEVYNVGSDHDFSNREVVDVLLALTGRDTSAIEFVKDRPGHDFRYAINATKIELELGWKPVVSFEEGIRALLAL
jgi:dTDP-glucose 4,6-dehydratase